MRGERAHKNRGGGALRSRRDAERIAHVLARGGIVVDAGLIGRRSRVERGGGLRHFPLTLDAALQLVVEAIEIGGAIITDPHIDAGLGDVVLRSDGDGSRHHGCN